MLIQPSVFQDLPSFATPHRLGSSPCRYYATLLLLIIILEYSLFTPSLSDGVNLTVWHLCLSRRDRPRQQESWPQQLPQSGPFQCLDLDSLPRYPSRWHHRCSSRQGQLFVILPLPSFCFLDHSSSQQLLLCHRRHHLRQRPRLAHELEGHPPW